MKTLLFLLIMTSNTFAFCPAFLGNMKQMVTSTPDACSACPSDTDGGDVVCEDFEGSGKLCSWDADVTTGGTVDEDASHSGTLSCTDKGSHALQITYTAASTDVYAKYDIGSAKTKLYYSFYLNAIDLGLAGAGRMEIFQTTNGESGGSYNFYIRADYVGPTTYQLLLRYINTTGSWVDGGTSATLDEDTWYRITIEQDTDSNILKMWVGASLVVNATDATNSYDPRYIYVGAYESVTTTTSGSYQIDNLKIDDDTMPSVCP